jgi:putative glutamine amidotransferase
MIMPHYRPVIGISCRPDTSGLYPGRPVNAQGRAYSDAIIQAGGIPVLIPVEVLGDMLETLFHRMDGFVFGGGGDVDPVYYHEPVLVDNLTTVQKDRDEHEFQLIRMAIERRKPFFAICRGMQVMNVAAGGSLWQDLGGQNPRAMRHDYHYQEGELPRSKVAHKVRLEQASLLSKILETDYLPVNSLHHQAVKDVASGLRATGYAEDGVVEVLEASNHHPFGLGVQWHPEELVADQEAARKMFAAFVEASGNGYKNGWNALPNLYEQQEFVHKR